MRTKIIMISVTVISTLILAGCGGMGSTVFLHPDYNFQYLEKIAVIPFENLSKEQGAGSRVTRIVVSELLSAQVFDVVEPGEVSLALQKEKILRTGELSKDQIKSVGQTLGVQGVILGTVSEISAIRSGGSTAHTVTLDIRMVDTESGVTVWSATNTTGGKGFFSSLLGTGEKSQSEVIRKCVRKTLNTLID